PDYRGRDGCRTPMPWNDHTVEAGFTAGEPWLPIPEEHAKRAVSIQENDPASPLNRVRRFLNWRKDHPIFKDGSIRFLDAGEDVVAFMRETGDDTIICVFNLAPDDVLVDIPTLASAHPIQGHGFDGTKVESTLTLKGFDAFFGTITSQTGQSNG
ncbi:MAG: alpha-glucosidase C-terminal domain-containing protein, partial [Pseudomonadota bacterium]